MKHKPTRFKKPTPCIFPDTVLAIQAPLPGFLDTLPKLLTIEGQGSVLAGCAPPAPPEPSPNE